MKTGVRIVWNRLLGGWYIVRGPHETPIGGRFDSMADAQAYLNRRRAQAHLEREVEAFCDLRDYLGEAAAERQADKAECRHVYAPCDPVCIHCGAKLPMPAGRVYNAFGSMVPCPEDEA